MFCKNIMDKLYSFFHKHEDFRQKNSLLNILPYEIQIKIFQNLKPAVLAKNSSVCKEWKILTHHPLAWQNINSQLGLSQYSDDGMRDYRFGLAFAKLKIDENLGNEIFCKIQQMEIWQEEIDFKCPEGSFEHGVYHVSDITKMQNKKDKKDYIGKKLVGNELVLIFIKANRWNSKVYRFNLDFNSNSFEKDEYLYWTYGVGSGISGFYLSKNEKEQHRNIELAFAWISLKSELNKLFMH